jgi:hypothetical protein
MGEKTGLIEGMGVTAIISIGTETSPAVPNDAIVTSASKHYIFIRTDKKPEEHHEEGAHEHENEEHKEQGGIAFERVEVARGTSDLGYTEITPVAELPANAQVVVKGSFFILAKMTNTGEHEH